LSRGAEIGGGDLLIAGTADEGGLLAGLGVWAVGDVDDGLIHGDASEDRAALAVDENGAVITEGERNAVAVAGGEDGESGGST